MALATTLATTIISPLAFSGDTPKFYEEVIVTGQKIARSLQDTPTSVAVINDVQMEQNNISTFSEFLIETANTSSTKTGGFSIRGIDGFNVSGGGNSFLASVYVDGASLPQRLIYSGFSTWDASQVEIMRGPQSTLQGRNALAGAVIMTTQTPTQEWETKYRVQSGQNGESELAIAMGGGLVEDQLSFRFSGEKKETDGFVRNITRNEPSDHREDELYRIKFLLEPSALPDFSAQLSFTHATSVRGATDSNVPDSGGPYRSRYTTNNDPQDQADKTDLINLELKHSLSDRWQMTAVTSYTEVDSGWDNYDDDNGPEAGGTRGFQSDIETLSQELRFVFDYEQLSGVVGAYYYDQKYTDEITGTTSLSLASVGLSSSFLQAQYGLDADTAELVISQYAPFSPVQLEQIAASEVNITSYALFGDVTYQINERWDIFAGLRWDRETQDNSAAQDISIGNSDAMPKPSNYVDTPLAALIPLISGINEFIQQSADNASAVIPLVDASFNTVLPKLGVSYHWSDDITTSFTVQEGYRSGGVGTNSATSSPFQYDPEYTSNYELSFRSTWLEGALTANANVFYIDWKDQQVNVQLSSSSFDRETRNAGQSTVKGFELDLSYQLTDELKLYASLGRAQSEFVDFTINIPTNTAPIVYELNGRSFADAPEWTSNIGATYVGVNGFFANVSVNYADSSPSEVNPYSRGLVEGDEGFDLENDARALVNFQLGYEWGNVGVYLIGKNLFDEEYIASPAYINKATTRHRIGDPRQLSVSVRGAF